MDIENVALTEVIAAARGRHASLVQESAGHLLLAVVRVLGRRPQALDPARVLLNTEGVVTVVGPSSPADDATATETVLETLDGILQVVQGAATALHAIARRRPQRLESLHADLHRALIPINRAASKRGLARLARETVRAKNRGLVRPEDVGPVRRPTPSAAIPTPTPASAAAAPASPAPTPVEENEVEENGEAAIVASRVAPPTSAVAREPTPNWPPVLVPEAPPQPEKTSNAWERLDANIDLCTPTPMTVLGPPRGAPGADTERDDEDEPIEVEVDVDLDDAEAGAPGVDPADAEAGASSAGVDLGNEVVASTGTDVAGDEVPGDDTTDVVVSALGPVGGVAGDEAHPSANEVVATTTRTPTTEGAGDDDARDTWHDPPPGETMATGGFKRDVDESAPLPLRLREEDVEARPAEAEGSMSAESVPSTPAPSYAGLGTDEEPDVAATAKAAGPEQACVDLPLAPRLEDQTALEEALATRLHARAASAPPSEEWARRPGAVTATFAKAPDEAGSADVLLDRFSDGDGLASVDRATEALQSLMEADGQTAPIGVPVGAAADETKEPLALLPASTSRHERTAAEASWTLGRVAASASSPPPEMAVEERPPRVASPTPTAADVAVWSDDDAVRPLGGRRPSMRPRHRGRAAAMVALAGLAAAATTAIIVGRGSERLRSEVATVAVPSGPDPAGASDPTPATPRSAVGDTARADVGGVAVVLTGLPAQNEVLMRLGATPLRTELPRGRRLEVVATAPNQNPERLVIQPDVAWTTTTEERLPTLRVSVGADVLDARGHRWPPAPPGRVGGAGPAGTLVVTSAGAPAEVWLAVAAGTDTTRRVILPRHEPAMLLVVDVTAPHRRNRIEVTAERLEASMRTGQPVALRADFSHAPAPSSHH
ncbi:MAG: hypothetical protein AAGN82_01735 [Myxococcota bacterium]